MITFKELQTLANIFSKPAPDNPLLNDIEDELETAVIEGRHMYPYASNKYDEEVVRSALEELEECGYRFSYFSYENGELIIEFRW